MPVFKYLYILRRSFGVFAFVLILININAQNHPALLPAPKKIAYSEGKLNIKNIVLSYETLDAATAFATKQFALNIQELTGIKTKTTTTQSLSTLKYNLKRKTLEQTSDNDNTSDKEKEYYKISIKHNKITIDANTSSGVYYAIQTLTQLIEKDESGYSLPYVEIEDWPSIQYRGVMMDFAHGGLLKVEEIKRQIDFLTKWKVNQYYFYNEISIMLDGHEELSFKQGYTKNQIREIVNYGMQRHIDVIPFITLYGHLHDLLKREKYAALGIGKYGHELDPRKPETQKLVSDWIKQYTDLFPSKFIHVGFDETWETNRISQEEDSSIHSEQLWITHLKTISTELKKYNKIVLAWTDMTNYYPELANKLPQDVLPVVWEYAPDSNTLYKYLNPILNLKRKFFIQPAVSGWGHIYPQANYTYDNIDLCIKASLKENAIGFITSVWTDAVEPLSRPSWPFMAYGSIVAWQGDVTNRIFFEEKYAKQMFPQSATGVQKACEYMAGAIEHLKNNLGKNTSNMPGGTIIESWSNPFDEYYLKITKEGLQDFKNARLKAEEAEILLIKALEKNNGYKKEFIESLLVTAKLIHYETTRFIWAYTISERWDKAMLKTKKNNFVFYDIGYLCHGLIQDVMDELGTLKDMYPSAWLSENISYRLNTILSRFDVEYGLWQKLLLKVINHRIKNPVDYVENKSFIETFKPDF